MKRVSSQGPLHGLEVTEVAVEGVTAQSALHGVEGAEVAMKSVASQGPLHGIECTKIAVECVGVQHRRVWFSLGVLAKGEQSVVRIVVVERQWWRSFEGLKVAKIAVEGVRVNGSRLRPSFRRVETAQVHVVVVISLAQRLELAETLVEDVAVKLGRVSFEGVEFGELVVERIVVETGFGNVWNSFAQPVLFAAFKQSMQLIRISQRVDCLADFCIRYSSFRIQIANRHRNPVELVGRAAFVTSGGCFSTILTRLRGRV